MRIGVLWNKLAEPKNIPRLFAFSLGIILIIGLIVPMALNPDQLYPRPAPQEQVDAGLAIAPYDRVIYSRTPSGSNTSYNGQKYSKIEE